MDYNLSDQIPPEIPSQQAPQFKPPEPHRGMLVLIFGIIGMFSCAIFSLLAWIFGNEDLKKMQDGRMDPAGRDITNVGRILGIITVSLHALGLIAGLVWTVFMLGVAMSGMTGIFGG